MSQLIKSLVLTTIDDIDGPESTTERRLIAAGEEAIGEKGIEGALLYEICDRANQSNRSAVHYYFNDKSGLIEAILNTRLRAQDKRRLELMHMAQDRSLTKDIRALLEIIYFPMAEQINRAGSHTWARFLLQYSTNIQFGFERAHPFMADREKLNPARNVIQLLAEATGLTTAVIRRRMTIQSVVLWVTLIDRDRAIGHGRRVPSLQTAIDEAIDLIGTGMTSRTTAE